ncbi:MAG: hypothetical protein WDZ84_03240 [Rhodovibrionaceae bacterium]
MFRNLAILAIAALSLSATSFAAGSAQANGFSESRPWQFRTTADRANNAAVLDLIERKKGGYYDGFNTNITNNVTNTTNFAGDQVNCNVSASATGNASSGSMDADAGNASVSSSVSNSATTTGNQADNSLGTPGSSDSVAFGILNDNSGQPGSSYTLADLINNDQGVNDSNLDASADGNSSSFDGGTVSGGDGSSTNQVLNNTQDNDGDQTATVNDSTACAFTNSTGDGGQ